MALTLGTADKKVPGAEFVSIVDVTFDSSYPLGGEAVVASDFGLNTVRTILPAVAVDPDTADNAIIVAYDPAAAKLRCFWSNSDAADGPLVEVPDTTDLSAYTASVVVYGV